MLGESIFLVVVEAVTGVVEVHMIPFHLLYEQTEYFKCLLFGHIASSFSTGNESCQDCSNGLAKERIIPLSP